MAGYSPALVKMFAIRHADNVKAIEGFAFATLAIAGIFILLHLSRDACHGLRRGKRSGSVLTVLSAPMRYVTLSAATT